MKGNFGMCVTIVYHKSISFLTITCIDQSSLNIKLENICLSLEMEYTLLV
jgi:hypothetical protein